MEDLPLWAQLLALGLLLLASAFFSISETSMMALNRYRLKHLAQQGSRGARMVLSLLERTDRLLGVILLGNNLINTLLTAVVTALAISYFGNDDSVLVIATSLVAFLLIVFCEITPKVIGATYPERIALPISFVLRPLLTLFWPVVWFVNLFVQGLLKLVRVNPGKSGETTPLSPEELRTLVLEAGSFIPPKHRSILTNLFDLEDIAVDDVMTPRGRVEAIDLDADLDEILEQLSNCYHNKIPVYRGEINRIVGVLHVRKALRLLRGEDALTKENLEPLLTQPYFIPSGTPLYQQLQYFQEQRQRLGLVVDEYGELMGLVTLEDIIEEIIGEFTTHAPSHASGALSWDADGEAIVDGTVTIRDLNRQLGLNFPLDGPKTLNGLVLEYLQDLPEGGVSIKVARCPIEIMQVQNHTVRRARLTRPPTEPVRDSRP